MKLTRTERWMLSNQFRILAALYPPDKDSYERMADIVERGYEGEYGSIAQYIYADNQTLSPEECHFVYEVMSMYWAMQLSADALGNPSSLSSSKLQFAGFDGNNETSYMSFARHLIADGGYTSLKRTKDLNSHIQSIAAYERMLAEWEALGKKQELSEEEIARILAARVHPTKR